MLGVAMTMENWVFLQPKQLYFQVPLRDLVVSHGKLQLPVAIQ